MKTVKAPNKAFTGISGGVNFTSGIAVVPDDTNTLWLEHHGYTVEKTEEAEAAAKEEAEVAAKAEADAKAQGEAEAAAKAEAEAKKEAKASKNEKK